MKQHQFCSRITVQKRGIHASNLKLSSRKTKATCTQKGHVPDPAPVIYATPFRENAILTLFILPETKALGLLQRNCPVDRAVKLNIAIGGKLKIELLRAASPLAPSCVGSCARKAGSIGTVHLST